MTDEVRSRTASRALAVVASVLVVGGVIALVVALRAQGGPPQPKASAAGTIHPVPASSTTEPATIPAPRPTRATTTTVRPPAAAPVSITIPSIGVHSTLIRLGLNADGSVEVPTSFHIAGWYERSVTPGTTGPAIILGHVDSKSGPGIFFRLGDLRPGDHVEVARADGSQANFVISGVRSYSKNQFPTLDVYGNTPVPTIRLITCGGSFDQATGHYLSNTIAFGQLEGS